jgi:hypothetical protein
MSSDAESSAAVTRSRKDLRRLREPERVTFLDIAGGVLSSWDGIERMQRLQAVRVIGASVPPLGPLAVLPDLVWLHVQNARVPEIEQVGTLRQLRTLRLTVPALDFDLRSLGALTQLEDLSFFVDCGAWPMIDIGFVTSFRHLKRLGLHNLVAGDASPLLELPETIEWIQVALVSEAERARVLARHPEAGLYCTVRPPTTARERDPIERHGSQFVTSVDPDRFGADDYEDAVAAVRRHLRKHAPGLLDQIELRWNDSVEISAASREPLVEVLALVPEGPWELR